ncbi:MAG: hypothetical protein V4493_09995 [Pseudomonadota bacterium]
MKRALLGKLIISSLVASSLIVGTISANASGFNKNSANDGKVMSSIKFYDMVERTQPNQVATNFGKPDEIITMKNASGDVAGVVWVYHDAVLKYHGMMDANFVLVNGQMKYVTLSDAV